MTTTPNPQDGDDHTETEEELQALFTAEARRLLKTLNQPASLRSRHEDIVAGLQDTHPDIYEKWMASTDTYGEAARFLFPFLTDPDVEMTDEQADHYQKLYEDAVQYGKALADAVKAKS
ncbi:hypothetical protein [Pigmentiphaga litoralis]|uniref:TipAS antibiotic-recognition domain-containing protein n=1 Tax=Pigmentiphaga litoralis TaxID=516702 RepID=A0A7Y9IUV3_9BURK|nr:hypothetical protein [Pigmentiphaga litoralis]NYE23095.1 hypothetical protein [Pigmentiphaga litoralis]NYE83290.1 hypothetical protein [Pigmentiphaga litoralis]